MRTNTNISKEYVIKAVDELIEALGVKEDVLLKAILDPFNNGKVKECIEAIADCLGLPVSVNLSYVPAAYQVKGHGTRFESSALAVTDDAGRGVEGINAQVSIPSYVPLYGSPQLKGFPISVKISDNCSKYPQTFVAVMAHELSHILLHSLRHKAGNNEIYTDITAMILGFSNVMKDGRKVVGTRVRAMLTETLTTTYGYLSDENFELAFDRIDRVLRENMAIKRRLVEKVARLRRQVSFYKQRLSWYDKLLEYLDKKPPRRMKEEDARKVVQFHQPDYTDFLVVNEDPEGAVERINDFCIDLRHYTSQRLEALRGHEQYVDKLASDLQTKSELVESNICVLRRYVGFFDRRKIDRQVSATS